MANEWLSWNAKRNQVNIIQKYTSGKEFRVGARNIPVDSKIPSHNGDRPKVLQFHGCLFHAHGCHLTNDSKTKEQLKINHVNGKNMSDIQKQTEKISKYIRANGFELEEMWECQ